MAVKTKTLF